MSEDADNTSRPTMDKTYWIKALIEEGLSNSEILRRLSGRGFSATEREVQAGRRRAANLSRKNRSPK